MSSLTITLIQPNLHWEDKGANLDMLSKKIDSIEEKTEVIILPEMFSTGFSMNTELLAENMNGETIQWMKKIASEKNCVLTGSIIIEDSSTNDRRDKRYFNRLIWMLPNGDHGYYDKRHLFAYGKEHQSFTAGNKRLIASAKGWKIQLQICYDIRFPLWLRQSNPANPLPAQEKTELEYDVLIVVANWPTPRIHAWKTLLLARAIENQCFVIGVNRTGTDGNGLAYSGDSMIIGPLGEVLCALSENEAIITLTLNKEITETTRKQFPFWKDADHFLIQS